MYPVFCSVFEKRDAGVIIDERFEKVDVRAICKGVKVEFDVNGAGAEAW